MERTKYQVVGGGGYIPIKQEVAALRLKMFAQKRWHCELTKLNTRQRMLAVYILIQHFEYTQKQCGDLLKCAPPVISRTWKNATFYHEKTQLFRTQVDNIYKYILYNVRYLR